MSAQLLTLEEVGQRLTKSYKTVRNCHRHGAIQFVGLPPLKTVRIGNRPLVPAVVFDAWLRGVMAEAGIDIDRLGVAGPSIGLHGEVQNPQARKRGRPRKVAPEPAYGVAA